MIAEESLTPAAPAPVPNPTAGMTTKVVKGSLWTLAGLVAPLAVSLVTTPFVIRMLRAESYGVLILIGLIPTYFIFSEFGMSYASTRFASEAYARGDLDEEARVVRTAALIAIAFSSVVAVAIAIFAGPIIDQFKVPDDLRAQAVTGLRICSAVFVTTVICGVINTPQLTRLRMDLNAAIGGVSKATSSVGMVVVLYLGGGIVGAAMWLLTVGILNILAHLIVSRHLLKQFFDISINRRLVRPLLKFGGGVALSGVASVLLVNLDKIIIGRLISVQSLAFYSIAFTFASVATVFSSSMAQSLVPAFSQLLTPERKQQFNDLFIRSLKLSIIFLLPLLTVLFVIARPFFTIWAGPDFGRESPAPFYILLGGLFFNVIAFIPWALIISVGRTELMAKILWSELVPYGVLAGFLTFYLGITGAALAWSLRVATDSVLQFWFARKVAGVETGLKRIAPAGSIAALILAPAPIIATLYDNYSLLLPFILVMSITLYTVITWRMFLKSDERIWFAKKLSVYLEKFAFITSR